MMGQLTSGEIESLLRDCVLGRIGCTNGVLIYVVPISYAYDGQYIYCHTHEGLKIDILRQHPAVCFEVERVQSMANWQSVIAHGVFEELTEPAARLDALQKLYDRRLPALTSETTRLTGEWPFGRESVGEVEGITFRIRMESKTSRFESDHANVDE
jgi:nitroimidazol reductase NimA-like FMN-containing flavoprotein (pyridoxamine 5'-phosphate oxidase superfamily)